MSYLTTYLRVLLAGAKHGPHLLLISAGNGLAHLGSPLSRSSNDDDKKEEGGDQRQVQPNRYFKGYFVKFKAFFVVNVL